MDSTIPTPLPLHARRDLVYRDPQWGDTGGFVVKDPLSLRYFRILPEQHRLLELLNHDQDLPSLRTALQSEFPTRLVTLATLQNLLLDLHQKGLIWSSGPGQTAELGRQRQEHFRARLRSRLGSLFYVRIPGFDPEALLRSATPWTGWIFHPVVLCMSAVFWAYAWIVFLSHIGEVYGEAIQLEQLYIWPNFLMLWLALGAVKMLHELGHAVACKRFGGECHEIGVALLMLSPTLYCDVSDAWLMSSRRHRILVAAAGIIVELTISSLALLVWRHTHPGVMHSIGLYLFSITFVSTVLVNANPLLRYDGYYMLADWLGITNLQSKSQEVFKQEFLYYCCGSERPENPLIPERRRLFLTIYAVLAGLYRVLILFGIGIFLRQLLKPAGLEPLADLYLLSVGLNVSWTGTRGVISMIRDAREHRMNRWRLSLSLVTLTGLLAVAACVPLPVRGTAPLTIDACQRRDVFTLVDGELTEIRVQPGDIVSPGQIIAVFESHALKLRLLQLQESARRLQIERQLAQIGEQTAELTLAEQGLATVQQQLEEVQADLDRLVIRSPCSGRIGSAFDAQPPVLPPTVHPDGPLSQRNLGKFCTRRTHVCTIQPYRAWQGVIYASQEQARELYVGMPVDVRLERTGSQLISGEVLSISPSSQPIAPRRLSSQFGGMLATTHDDSGNTRLPVATYEAIVLLDHQHRQNDSLFSGLTGTARFVTEQRTVAAWIWHFLNRHIAFRN